MKRKKIAFIGDGGWGTTLAIMLSRKNVDVSIWSAFPEYAVYLNRYRENKKFLPGFKIPGKISITSDLEKACSDSDVLVLAVPSQYLRGVLRKMKGCRLPRGADYLSVVKGIESGSLKRMSEVISEELGRIRVAVLSGPTIAREVALGIPTTAVIASGRKDVREELQSLFISESFRVYGNDDVIGVELGGSLKNVIAIACGISDGLGFGSNTKAALLSRGLAEIARLGVAMSAKPRTFSGISGLGDLVTTCISRDSRNRFVGEQIGMGRTLADIRRKMGLMIAEGVPTAESAQGLSLRYKVDMPICGEVYRVLYKSKSPVKAVRDLMTRQMKKE
jgi:glycerol-3-phosphate dehydrogenase (NAD(P)+)